MAIYKKSEFVEGNWVKGADIQLGARCKLVSETISQESQFKNEDGTPKRQDVARIQFEGGKEPLKIALNRATINGLVDAFGEDSKLWVNKVLTAVTEKARVGGKAVTAVYLVADGYQKIDDSNGYAVIIKQGSTPIEEDIKPEDLPF